MPREIVREHERVWDRLHELGRFRPVYPSEAVVRFVARRFGGIPDPVAGSAASDLLDVGCGAGRHTVMMAEAGHRVTGVDISQVGLDHARDRLRAQGLEARLELGDMSRLPVEDDSVDGVVAYGVFLYGTSEDFGAAVAEAHRVLRPGGRLLVVTRSTRDDRFRLGERLDDRTVRITDDRTNEAGTTMHFIDPERMEHFDAFTDTVVDHVDFSVEGRFLNADLVIEATK